MKLKGRIISFLVLLVLVASSATVYASEVEIQNVQPQVISYCTTASGLHEGVANNLGSLEKFYDKSKLPDHVFYPGLFTSYVCRGCGEVIYLYDYQGGFSGTYFYENALGDKKLWWVFSYRVVDPDFVYSGAPLHWIFPY